MALTNDEMKDVIKAAFHYQLKNPGMPGHVPMLFWGATGIGKTAGFEQAAEELSHETGKDVRCIIFKPGQADSAGDLLGMPEKVTYYPCAFCLQASDPSDEYTKAALLAHCYTGHNVQTWEEVETAMKPFGDKIVTKQRFAITDIYPTHGPVIICIDELNRAGPDIRNALFGMVGERRFELSGWVAPDQCIIAATCNPPTSDYADTHDLDGAMLKRFVHFEVRPTPEGWIGWMADKSEAQTDKGRKALGFFREHLDFCTPSEEKNPVLENMKKSNRTNAMLIRCANFLENRLLSEAASGTIGSKAAQAFMQHMNKQESWVRAKDIVKDYASVRAEAVKMVETGRNDMFLLTQDDVLKLVESRSKPLSKAEAGQLIDFMHDLIPDQVWSLSQGLYGIRKKTSNEPRSPAHKSADMVCTDDRLTDLIAKHSEKVDQARLTIQA
jgi:hypothetical protein